VPKKAGESYQYVAPAESLSGIEGIRYCNYTYRYNWIHLEDTFLEAFHISEVSRMELYDHSLKVIKGKERYNFPLRELREVKSGFTYYILPMIVGGVVTPLGGMALFNHYLNTWTALIMFVAGLLLFYFGLKGAQQVSVIGQQYQVNFFIDEDNRELKRFIDKVKIQIRGRVSQT